MKSRLPLLVAAPLRMPRGWRRRRSPIARSVATYDTEGSDDPTLKRRSRTKLQKAVDTRRRHLAEALRRQGSRHIYARAPMGFPMAARRRRSPIPTSMSAISASTRRRF